MLNCFETVMPCDKEVQGSIPANNNNSFQDPVVLFNLFGAINGEKNVFLPGQFTGLKCALQWTS